MEPGLFFPEFSDYTSNRRSSSSSSSSTCSASSSSANKRNILTHFEKRLGKVSALDPYDKTVTASDLRRLDRQLSSANPPVPIPGQPAPLLRSSNNPTYRRDKSSRDTTIAERLALKGTVNTAELLAEGNSTGAIQTLAQVATVQMHALSYHSRERLSLRPPLMI
jgi:hypothetical protein